MGTACEMTQFAVDVFKCSTGTQSNETNHVHFSGRGGGCTAIEACVRVIGLLKGDCLFPMVSLMAKWILHDRIGLWTPCTINMLLVHLLC